MKNWKLIKMFLMVIFVSAFCVTLYRPTSLNAGTKSISVLTYNVAGLPEIISSSNPSVNTKQISPIINDYNIAAVQEDFSYHKDLIKSLTLPYLTETSGNVPIGDGLNFLSKYPLSNTKRVTWNLRYGYINDGSDQMTRKGFMFSRCQLETDLYIDIYSLHTDAGGDSKSYAARRDNIKQIANYITTNSKDNAVIVLGDTNSRYTRSEDNFETDLLSACNLKDPWIQLVRNSKVPPNGSSLMDSSNKNGPNYEVVDKIFYRGNKSISLTPVSYRLEDKKFVDKSGKQLSDHYPVTANFNYSKVATKK